MDIQRVQQLLREHWESIPTLPGNPTFDGVVDDILSLDYLYYEGLPFISDGHEFEVVGLFVGHVFSQITGASWKHDESLELPYLSYFENGESFVIYPTIRFKEAINRQIPQFSKLSWCLTSMLIEFRQHVSPKDEQDNSIEAAISELDADGQIESLKRYVHELRSDRSGG